MTRTALVFPEPGTPPINKFVYMRLRVTTRPRGSNPNGNSENMSTRPSCRSGQIRRLALAGSCFATHSTQRPGCASGSVSGHTVRSEEHTSELQSRPHLVCRLLLEKKKKKQINSLN